MRKRDAGAKRKCGLLLIILLFVVTVLPCHARGAEVHLADYHALVVFTGDRDATVTATVRLAPDGMPEKVLIARCADQWVAGLAARSSQTPIPFTITDSSGALIINLSRDVGRPPAITLEIRYAVHSRVRLTRVPLPVMNVPPLPQQRPVTIETRLPAGMVAIGEGFPAVTWMDSTHGEIRLPAIPSVLVLDSRMEGSVSLLDRLLTPAALSTAAMLGLLLAGSVLWSTRALWVARRTR